MRSGLGFLVLFFCGFQVGLSQQMDRGHYLSGYVREEGTDHPVEAASLTMQGSGIQMGPGITSDLTGQFVFRGISDGDYHITVSKPGYETANVTVRVGLADVNNFQISLRRQRTSASTVPGDPVSTRALAIPEKARDAFRKGHEALAKANFAKALSEFERAIGLYPSYFEAYSEMAVAQYRTGKMAEAEESLRKAVELSSGKSPEILLLLAQLLNDRERYQESEPVARQALALNDASWNIHFELARSLVGLKRAPEAEASALKALELKPDSPQVLLVLANAHMQQREYASVVRDFDGYLKLAPDAAGSDTIRQRRDALKKALQQAQTKTDAATASPN